MAGQNASSLSAKMQRFLSTTGVAGEAEEFSSGSDADRYVLRRAVSLQRPCVRRARVPGYMRVLGGRTGLRLLTRPQLISDNDEFLRGAAHAVKMSDPRVRYAESPAAAHGQQSVSPEEQAVQNAKAIREVEEFAKYLGMDVEADRDLLWVAVEAMTAPLPPNWSEHNTRNGQPYYYNERTDMTQWEHPMDDYHRGLYKKLKGQKALGKTQEQLQVGASAASLKIAAQAQAACSSGSSAAGQGRAGKKSSIVTGVNLSAGFDVVADGKKSTGGGADKPEKAVAKGADACDSVTASKGRNLVSMDVGLAEERARGTDGSSLSPASSGGLSPLDSTAATSPLPSISGRSEVLGKGVGATGAGVVKSEAQLVEEAKRREAKARKEDKKARLRAQLAALKNPSGSDGGGGRAGGFGGGALMGNEARLNADPVDKSEQRRREEEKVRDLMAMLKDKDATAGAKHMGSSNDIVAAAAARLAPLDAHVSGGAHAPAAVTADLVQAASAASADHTTGVRHAEPAESLQATVDRERLRARVGSPSQDAVRAKLGLFQLGPEDARRDKESWTGKLLGSDDGARDVGSGMAPKTPPEQPQLQRPSTAATSGRVSRLA